MSTALPPVPEAWPVLYSFRRCPYAMRARLAIQVSGQGCALREVVLRHKPAELLRISPKGTVPVLQRVDGQVIDQSLDIMRWALALHDPQHWLAPTHGHLAGMLALIGVNDGAFKFHLDRYKYPQRYAAPDSPEPSGSANVHRDAGGDLLMHLEQRLVGTPHLFGDTPALADMAIAPFVRQFAHVDPEWFEAQPWPRLRGWLSAWEASPLLAAVMHKYPPWETGAEAVRFPAPAH